MALIEVFIPYWLGMAAGYWLCWSKYGKKTISYSKEFCENCKPEDNKGLQ